MASAEEPSREQISALGRRIYEQDVASARATDLLLAELEPDPDSGLRGWFTVRSGDGWLTRFVGATADAWVVLYDVRVGGENETVRIHDSPLSLTEDEVGIFLAGYLARGELKFRCTERYNPVIFTDGDGWLVYLLASTQQPGVAVVGGHHRIKKAFSGEVISVEPLSNACLFVPLQAPPGAEKSFGPVVTHWISDSPSEIHTYLSLLHDMPILVKTKTSYWRVDGDRSTELDCTARKTRKICKAMDMVAALGKGE